ncbi:Profilin/allergen [Corynespora cassiicola Philippines]|uniref:Profilin n=1 Tax=Corynespora cassiicola Philippines TaxID=1448308 RepID=A0A2T2NQY9_CORCC|nr:Profilin/allergen [Corynespora cassiicola Philippines]
MSWQAYVDQSLVGTGTVDKALICDVGGQTVWATTPGFEVTPEQMKAIAASFGDSSRAILGQGIKIGSDKYMAINSDDESLKGKKGKEGIVAVKTTQAILIAHHPEEVQLTNAFNTVVQLADYLKGVGY